MLLRELSISFENIIQFSQTSKELPTSKLHEKPPGAKRKTPANQNMKFSFYFGG
jgi:hypothetical protein